MYKITGKTARFLKPHRFIYMLTFYQELIMLIKRDKFDYTEWQKTLWQNETVESLSAKAQDAWNKNK